MLRVLIGCLLVGAVASPTRAASLSELLGAVRRNASSPTAVRADLRVTRGGQSTTAVLLGWRRTWYLETASGFRALVRAGKQAVVRDGHAARAGIRTLLPGTDLLLEELAFEGARLAFPQMQDDGPDGVVVAGESSDPSLYVLLVRTIDPKRAVVVDAKYYKDDIATLVKNRRDAEFVQVDGHWRPQRIEVEDYVERSTTVISLAWRTAADLPRALFTPGGLTKPSGLTIPR